MEKSCPFDLAEFRRFIETLPGVQTGFTNDADRLRLPHLVRLDGLSRSALGGKRFDRVFIQCRSAAMRVSGYDYRIEPIYNHRWERTGYEFRFANKLTAMRFAICHQAAMANRPSPLLGFA